MLFFLLTLFLFTSLSMVLWGLQCRENYFQFPLLTGAVWFLYLGPMAIGIFNNRNWLPDGVEQDAGIEMALLLGTACMIASIIAYRYPAKVHDKPNKHLSNDRLFLCGVIFILISYWAFLKLAALSGGIWAYYSVDGAYNLEWTGLPVAYDFFSKLIYPGFILCLFAFLDKQTMPRLLFLVTGAAFPVANILIRGRRSELVAFALIIALSFFFKRKWAPSRFTVMLVLLSGISAILIAPVYRAHSQLGGDKNELWNINTEKLLTSVLSGNEYTELHYAAVQLPATYNENEYNWGRGFYNRLVHQWVPKLIVGSEMKNSMFLSGPDFAKHTMENYGWSPQKGWIPTVIVDVFRELSFFGFLLFIPFAALFRRLWSYAQSGNEGAQIFYVALAPSAMYAIVSGLTAFVAQLLYLIVFLLPVLLFSSMSTENKKVNYA